MNNWLFKDPPNVAVITTFQVLKGNPILWVSHDEEDGGWQFHTGEMPLNIDDAKLVSLQKILLLDPSIEQLADLPLGWIATRDSVQDNWHRLPQK